MSAIYTPLPRKAKDKCREKLEAFFRDEFEIKKRCAWGPDFYRLVWETSFKTDAQKNDCHGKLIKFADYGKFSVATGWEIGHKRGVEWKRIISDAGLYVGDEGSSPAAAYAAIEFIHKTPAYFQPENCSDNRSHAGEYSGGDRVGLFLRAYDNEAYNSVVYSDLYKEYKLCQIF